MILANGVTQNYMWVADYGCSVSLREFENNGVENSFYAINKDLVSSFFLTGPMQIGYTTDSGRFFIVNGARTAQLEIKLGSELITRPSKDIIQYKDAVDFFSPGGGKAGAAIERCNIGYKWSDGDRSAKIIAHVGNHTNEVCITVRLVWDQDFEGLLLLNGRGFPVQLKKGKAEEFPIKVQEGNNK